MIHTIDLNFLGHSQSIASFLVETSAGPVLVETGPHSVLKNLEKGINKAGYELSDIKNVLLTHIHLDHAGAAWYFAKENGATIYVHPFGQRHLADPSKLMHSAKRIYQDKMDMLWGQMNEINADQIKTPAHGEAVVLANAEGTEQTTFTAWHTPGHAVHHIAWQLGDVLFSGDVAGVRIDNGMVVPPCPPPDIYVEDWIDSINLMRGLNLEALYLTHFGKVTDIEDHLNKLEEELHAWANWMKPYFEQGADMKAITPRFQAWVAGRLARYNIMGEALAKYEAANPSWMSVAGLMRYWKKKTA